MKRCVIAFALVLLVVLYGCKPSENNVAVSSEAETSTTTEAVKPVPETIQAPEDMMLLDKLVQEYYLKQELEAVPKIMQLLDAAIAKQGQEVLLGMSAPMLGFFSQIFKHNPKQLKTWETTLFALSSRELKLVLLNALCFANNDEARNLLASHCEDFPELKNIQFNQEPPNLLELPLEAPELLDLTWGAFFATGDLAFVKRILDVACMPEKDKQVNLTIRAALWSIVTSADRHTKVHRFLNETLSKASNETLRTFVKSLTMENRKMIFDDELLLKVNILQVPPKADETLPHDAGQMVPKQ